MAEGQYVTNPKTNRKILVGGPTYKKLINEGVSFGETTRRVSPKKSPITSPKKQHTKKSPTTEVIGFWKPDEENGYLSQWYSSTFVVDGVTYSCAEQAMMAAKASTFHDQKILEKIMATKSPKMMKTLGKKISGFSDAVWNRVKYNIVVKNNLAKFSQNPDLLKMLLSTGDNLLAELSPFDKVWGVGTKSKNQKLWKGENLLGKAIMEVRNRLQA